ncbi:MAG TPA: sigma factor [Thermoanaerobaculia bacterium]|jgi:DNA-directed RNA polymerase specialized sigma24 family protein
MADFHQIPKSPGTPESAGSVTALIATLAIEIDSLFSRFHLSEEEAEDLLRETLLLAIYRWDTIDSREIWLLSTLRRACLRRLRRRSPSSS